MPCVTGHSKCDFLDVYVLFEPVLKVCNTCNIHIIHLWVKQILAVSLVFIEVVQKLLAPKCQYIGIFAILLAGHFCRKNNSEVQRNITRLFINLRSKSPLNCFPVPIFTRTRDRILYIVGAETSGHRMLAIFLLMKHLSSTQVHKPSHIIPWLLRLVLSVHPTQSSEYFF